MLIAAISSSACSTRIPYWAAWPARNSSTGVPGVIGYEARNRHPAAIAPAPTAWPPVRSIASPRLKWGGGSCHRPSER